MLTGLLQVVDEWPYTFLHDVGTLSKYQEFAVNTGEEQEHTVTRIEFPRLGGCRCGVAQPGPLVGAKWA